MASFFSSVRQGFGRQSNKGNNPPNKRDGQGTPSPTSYQSISSITPSVPPIPHSPALSASMSLDNQAQADMQASGNRKPPYFFRQEYASLIVKGNFMTLAAKPILVEEGEWLAHQVVEQYRLLDQMIDIIKTVDEKTGRPICNPEVCPTMWAAGHTYTWLDHAKNPVKIPAIQYINRVQKWIVGKISDSTLFPTDTTFSTPSSYASGGITTPRSNVPIPAGPTSLNAPLNVLAGREWLGKSSGFSENFESDIKSIYRQMMRCYSHIYYGHWIEPFWYLNAYKELNTCFIHFVNVGKLFNLLSDKDMEPMQPLIDLWLAGGLLPQHVSSSGPQQQQQLPQGSGTVDKSSATPAGAQPASTSA